MAETPKMALVAAMEREVAPLIRGWAARTCEFEGRTFRFFEKGNAVMVCGGIGAESARRATEAVLRIFHPESVWSVGLAGGLDSQLKAGDVFVPRWVVDVRDGSRVDTREGEGVLVSFPEIAGVVQKAKLAQSYDAQAVDMEAAAVAKGAQVHGVPFRAVKAISDNSEFAMPPMNQFITPDGKFKLAHFLFHASIRPWLWPSLVHLGRNSGRAARALCHRLEQVLAAKAAPESSVVLHPVSYS